MLNPKQADAVASALLARPAADSSGDMQRCPVCCAEAISAKERKKLHAFGSLECSACHTKLRIKWMRQLIVIYIAALITLGIWTYFFHRPSEFWKMIGAITTMSASILGILERKLPLVSV
jgi:hypothetical protein